MTVFTVTGVGIVAMPEAGEARVMATMVSIAAGFSARVTVTPVSLWVQEATPPVRAEHERTFAGKAGRASLSEQVWGSRASLESKTNTA